MNTHNESTPTVSVNQSSKSVAPAKKKSIGARPKRAPPL